MAIWRHPDVLDYGLDRIKTACNSIALIDYDYVAGDSYTTVRGTADVNIIAEQTGVTSANITLSAYGTNGRKAVTAQFTPTSVKTSSGVAGRLKFALLDTVNSKVLAIVDEGTDQIVTISNVVTIPALTLASIQPA